MATADNNTNSLEKRFDRVEEKLDKLSDAMISLARTEEKILAMEKNYRNHYDRMNRFSEKLDRIEKKVDDNERVVRVIGRVFWVILTAVVGITITIFTKGLL
jgi:tetrahydromethanopterin S-methyltransferase subunit G